MSEAAVRLEVDARVAPPGVIRDVAAVAKEFPGSEPVYLDLLTSIGPKLLELGPDYRVDPLPSFYVAVRDAINGTRGWREVAYIDETHRGGAYWICGLVVPTSEVRAAQDALEAVARQAARDYGLHSIPELHGYTLFQGAEAFTGIPPRARVGIYAKALDAVLGASPAIVLRGVDPVTISSLHPHRLAWRYAIESIDELADEGRVLVVADRHAETEAALRSDIRAYLKYGTGGWKGHQIRRVIPDLLFVDSRANRLLQAADLIAYLHQRRFNVPVEGDDRAQRARELLWQKVEPAVKVALYWESRPQALGAS